MLYLVIAICVILFLWWNSCLPFYKDRNKDELVSDESKCFSPECRSITYDRGRKRCVLMIHGYPTAPNMYAYTAKRLDEAGFDVFIPLIPTFGADPEEFKKTEFSQWYNYIDKYYMALRKRYAEIHVGGVSMGGAMTLRLAEEHSSTPLAMDSIFVISAPVAYNCLHLGIVTSWAGYLARTLGLFVKTFGLGIVDGRPDGDDGNEEWRGYKGVVIRHGLSLQTAFNRIRRDLGRISVPMFIMHDKNDRTVPYKNLDLIARGCGGNVKVRRDVEMDKKWKHSHHSLLMYHSVQEGYTDEIIAFLEKGGGR